MKLSKRILASVASLAIATTMLSATYASAADTEVELASISTAPELRKNGIDLKPSEVYSTVKELPAEPTVGIAFEMGGSYNYRGQFSAMTAQEKSSSYANGDKFTVIRNISPWAYFYVHAAQISQTDEGVPLMTKNGKAAKTIGVSQPGGAANVYYKDGVKLENVDPENIPDGAIQYFQEAQLVDATITGAGTYKAAIVGHDFANDSSTPGFNMFRLSTNVGYFDGLVSNNEYVVNADSLKGVISSAEEFLPVLEEQLEALKAQAAEKPEEDTTEAEDSTEADEPAEDTTDAEPVEDNEATIEEQIAKTEQDIAAIKAALETAKSAAAKDGTKLAGDYSLEIAKMTYKGYNSAEAYEAGTPDIVTDIPGFVVSTNGTSDTYNFPDYYIDNIYGDKGFQNLGNGIGSVTKDDNGNVSGYIQGNLVSTDGSVNAIGTSVKTTDNGAKAGILPTYALEIEFTIDEGKADVFGYQGDINEAASDLTAAIAEAGGLVWNTLNKAIADAEAVDSSKYTTTSYEALMSAVQAAKDLIAKYENGEDVTQEEIDAAVEAITAALNALEPIEIPSEPTTNGDDNNNNTTAPTDGSGNGSNGSSATDPNPSTGAGVAVTGAMALLVGAGFTISRKRK